jgi:tRNA G10  N-methylase Trm11
MTNNIFLLGRQPNLGIAELESVFSSDKIKLVSDNAVTYDGNLEKDIIKKLGGVQKIGTVIGETGNMSWPQIEDYIKKDILPEILNRTEGKIKFGVSCYGVNIKTTQLNGSNIALKKVLRAEGRPVRIIPNNDEALSTAQVLHNQLTEIHGFELLIVKGRHGLVFAKTDMIQDINGYTNRDQNRPKRDARVGMLPPKLAQIMINIANPSKESVIIDPFCGTGVILQESLLMSHEVFGTDIDPRMIDYSEINLNWLKSLHPNIPKWKVEVGNATDHKWNSNNFTVVCETLLGRPLSSLPPINELKKQALGLNNLMVRFLENLALQLKTDQRICIAIPAWVVNDGFIYLPLLDHLEEIGYNRIRFRNVDASGLIYYRPDQLVARQLLVLVRK